MSKPDGIRMKISYDELMHQALTKIFRERCLTNDQIKEFINTDWTSVIKLILEQEPALSAILNESSSSEKYRGLPLLWIAICSGYLYSAELLVRSGADVNQTFTLKSSDPQMMDENHTYLHMLIMMGRNGRYPFSKVERLIQLVMDHGADLQARDHLGKNLLHWAIEECIELTETFLEKGVDVNAATDKDGYHLAKGTTPMLAAVTKSKANKLVPLLMKHGADVFAKNSLGQNALHLLADDPVERVGLARALLEKGVSPHDVTTEQQYQPIHLAALRGKNELIKLFLDFGANVNARSKHGESPLYLAAKRRAPPAILETLLKRGASPDLRTIQGRTALHSACQSFKNIGLLLAAGADPLVEDNDGKKPFDLIDPQYMENQSVRPMMEELLKTKVRLVSKM